MKSNIQVGVAAFLGSLPVATTLLVDKLEPLFRVLALGGQVAVALVSVVYIITKILAVWRSRKDDE